MIAPLKTEDWSFSNLGQQELIPALAWEFRRERPDLEQVVEEVRAWVKGKLPDQKPPVPKDQRSGKPRRQGREFHAPDMARVRAMAIFTRFIPLHECPWLHENSPEERVRESDRWLASHLRSLLQTCGLPWLCLAAEERQRLSRVFESEISADIVTIGTWWDAVAQFKQQKPDAGLPLKFDFSEYTSVLLTMDWRHGQKRILAEIGKILKQLEPAGIKRWDRRGKKHRDFLVMLERLAMTRLLHHYTLSEVKRLFPVAWRLYQNRKWYDERRRCLKDFRFVTGFTAPEKWFPKSWETKAQGLRTTRHLPAK